MRKVIASVFVTLDGYMVGPNEDISWVTNNFNEEMGKYAGDLMNSMDTIQKGDQTMRFLMYTIGDDSVPIPPPSPEVMAEMGKFMNEATNAGVLLATGAMTPSSQGATVRFSDGKFTVTDGPYAEAKELIGGWALVQVASKAEALDWAKRFLRIVGVGESRIRQVFGPEDMEPDRG
jgi:hypothetical protein